MSHVKDRTILVVEDEQPLMEAIKSKLELEGFSVVTARGAEQALDYMNEGVKIDAVWLDHYLFGSQSGLDFAAKLREKKDWEKMPIFVVSNTVSPDKVKLYQKLGVQGCYTKVDHRLDKIAHDIKAYLKREQSKT